VKYIAKQVQQAKSVEVDLSSDLPF
jgi:hypothetical protein